MCSVHPIYYTPISIRTVPVMLPAESLSVYRPPDMSWAGTILPSRLSHHMYTIAWVHPSPNRKQPQVVQPFLAQFMAESLYLTMGRPFPLKIAVCMGRPGPPSNTWFPEPTQVKNILNGITISSTIFAELTVVTDRLQDHTTAIYSSRTHLPI